MPELELPDEVPEDVVAELEAEVEPSVDDLDSGEFSDFFSGCSPPLVLDPSLNLSE